MLQACQFKTTKSFHSLLKFNDRFRNQVLCPVACNIYNCKSRTDDFSQPLFSFRYSIFLAQNPSNKMEKQKRVGLKVS